MVDKEGIDRLAGDIKIALEGVTDREERLRIILGQVTASDVRVDADVQNIEAHLASEGITSPTDPEGIVAFHDIGGPWHLASEAQRRSRIVINTQDPKEGDK